MEIRAHTTAGMTIAAPASPGSAFEHQTTANLSAAQTLLLSGPQEHMAIRSFKPGAAMSMTKTSRAIP